MFWPQNSASTANSGFISPRWEDRLATPPLGGGVNLGMKNLLIHVKIRPI